MASVTVPVEAKPMPEMPDFPEEEMIEQPSEDVGDGLYIGRALLSEELPIEMKNSLDDRRIYGFVRQNFIPEIVPPLISDRKNIKNTIFYKIRKIDKNRLFNYI